MTTTTHRDPLADTPVRTTWIDALDAHMPTFPSAVECPQCDGEGRIEVAGPTAFAVASDPGTAYQLGGYQTCENCHGNGYLHLGVERCAICLLPVEDTLEEYNVVPPSAGVCSCDVDDASVYAERVRLLLRYLTAMANGAPGLQGVLRTDDAVSADLHRCDPGIILNLVTTHGRPLWKDGNPPVNYHSDRTVYAEVSVDYTRAHLGLFSDRADGRRDRLTEHIRYGREVGLLDAVNEHAERSV